MRTHLSRPAPLAYDAPRNTAQVVLDVAHVRRLRPVAKRNRWIGWGLFVQALGIGALVAWAYSRYKHDAALGLAARATVTLVWQETMHSRTGLLVVSAAAIVFAVGSVIAARPFVRSIGMLVVGVPVAAIAGIAVLGAIALLLAIVWSGLNFDWPESESGRRKREAKQQQQAS